jgi:hypothetical protein
MDKLIKSILERQALEAAGKQPPKKAELGEVTPALKQMFEQQEIDRAKREKEINTNGFYKGY